MLLQRGPSFYTLPVADVDTQQKKSYMDIKMVQLIESYFINGSSHKHTNYIFSLFNLLSRKFPKNSI